MLRIRDSDGGPEVIVLSNSDGSSSEVDERLRSCDVGATKLKIVKNEEESESELEVEALKEIQKSR